MVVCKFFQQGNCRYGQNCRFDHIYGSKYSYHANPPTNVTSQEAPAPTEVTDEQLVNQVQSDIQTALRGGQWILSSYAPYKEKPGYPGLSDLSPEEARLFIYEAKAKNTVDQAVCYMNNLYKETRNKYEQLLQPTLNTIKVLRSLYRGEIVSQPTFATSNNASSIFRSAVNNAPASQSNPASIFNQGQSQSIFGQQTTNNNMFGQTTDNNMFGQTTGNNVFGQTMDNNIFGKTTDNNIFGQTVAAKSIFAQANNAFEQSASTNIFQTSEPKSIFAAENQKVFVGNQAQNVTNPGNIFASASQSIFGKVEPSVQTVAQTNIFQTISTPTNIFQQNSNLSENEHLYSKLEELSQDDLEAFKSENFQLGFVPEVPPPLSLCT